MSVLDQVMDLKTKGISDQEIARMLQEKGVSPADINDAFSRAQIKNAISMKGMDKMERSVMDSEDDSEPERLPVEGLEGGTLSDVDLTPPIPSGFMGQALMPIKSTKEIEDESAEMYEPKEAPPQQQYPQQQYPQFEGYDQPAEQQYSQFQGYDPQASYQYQTAGGMVDTDTVIEVSEQVFSEKNRPLQKKIDDMDEFRALAQANIEHISERLKKIEAVIDRLQASILEKVGSYGQGLDSVKKEMGMMQESFSKIVNNLAEKSEEKHHVHHHPHLQHHEPPVHHQHTEHHATHPQHHTHHHVTIHKSKKVTRKRHSRK